MKKHIRYLSKSLDKKIGCAGITFFVLFVVLTYLLYFSPSLKRIIFNESSQWVFPLFTRSGNIAPYLPLQTEYYKNCGLKTPCATTSFPIHLYTGWKNIDLPQVCINERKLSASNIGRGFNVIIFDNITSTILRRGHFDTFIESSEHLEIFLEVLKEGDIVIIVTHDEASSKLSPTVRSMLNNLGSSFVQDLDYRDVWVFVGQKGINGFSIYEHIEYLMPRNHWPKSINKRFCVQRRIPGTTVRPDAVHDVVLKKEMFCSKMHFKDGLCTGFTRDMPLRGTDFDSSTKKDSINKIPIILVPGSDINIFRMQAEALMLNENFNANNVNIFSPKDEVYVEQLAHLFKFKIHSIGESLSFYNYTYVFNKALEKAWELFHEKQYCIFIEEGVIPSNDFLNYMGFAIQILDKNGSIFGASSWNNNGHLFSKYKDFPVIRSKHFPGLGILMRRSTFDRHLRNKLSECCHKRSWAGWNLVSPVETIIPEISKVIKVMSPLSEWQDSETLKTESIHVNDIFFHGSIRNFTLLTQNSLLAQEVSSCVVLSHEVVMKTCQMIETNIDNHIFSSSHPSCICYKQANGTDSRILSKLLPCFNKTGDPPKINQATGVTEAGDILILGSLSPYYVYLPKNHDIITEEHFKIIEAVGIKS